jgi:tetratricopeptide (TPR) repeat protein
MRRAAERIEIRRKSSTEIAGGRRGSAWAPVAFWTGVVVALVVILGAAAGAQPSASKADADAKDAKAPKSAKDAKAQAAAPDTVRQLEIAAQKDTASFDKSYRLGVAYLDRDRAQEAVPVFQRCTRLRPAEVKGWVNFGAALDAIGKGSDARAAYRVALAHAPGDEIALCRLGASLYAGGSKAAAMDTLRVTLAKYPSSYCAYFTLGVAFADAQMYDEAIRAWEKVVAAAPDTPEALSAKESIATLRELMKTP